MKKVVVIRVEDVLVKKYDVKKVYDLRMKKMVKERVGSDFEEEMKRMKVKGSGVEELMGVVDGLERRYEDEGNGEKMWKMRGVKKFLEEMNERGGERMMEMEREYFEDGFEKRKIGCGEVLRDLERVSEVMKGFEMVFVSGLKKRSVENLLFCNGLSKVRVVGSFEELGEVEKEKVVMFGSKEDVKEMEERGIRCVEGVKNVFEEIGLRKK